MIAVIPLKTADPFVPEIAAALCVIVGIICGFMKTRYMEAFGLTQWLTGFSHMLYLWCFHIAEDLAHGWFWLQLSQIPTSPILPWGLRIANLFFDPGVTPVQMLVARIGSATLIVALFSAGFWAGKILLRKTEAR